MILELLATTAVAIYATDRWHRRIRRVEPVAPVTLAPLQPPIEFNHDAAGALTLLLCHGDVVEHEIHTHKHEYTPETYSYGGKTYTLYFARDDRVAEYQR